MKKPELLAPAGDLEKLKTAFYYGADAVYIGGESYGLRAKAKNFTNEEMAAGIDFAHGLNKKVYVTANIIAHQKDFEGMGEYFAFLQDIHADGLIVSDPGIFMVAKQYAPELEIHISTQANNTNAYSAKFWYEQGATRVVTARELSLAEIKEMKTQIPEGLEIESFVHGAMCISYSGRCLLSNYMSGRDANQGACAHPCRWKYYLMEEKRPGEYMPVYENERGTFIYNAKDLCMIAYIGDLVAAGINSFKIEGRMKTPYYVATVVKAYRQAIDDYFRDQKAYQENIGQYMALLQKASHRDYTTGFYFGKPSGKEQNYGDNSYIRTYDFCAVVLDYDAGKKMAKLEQRNKFVVGDTVEFMPVTGGDFPYTITALYDEAGKALQEAPHPKQTVYIPLDRPVEKYSFMRKKV